MRRILYRVREGNQLLVVVERAGPAMLNHLRTQRGISRTQQNLAIPRRPAGRTSAVMPGFIQVAFLTGLCAGAAKHLNQFLVAAGLATPRVGLYVAARNTNMRNHAIKLGLFNTIRRVKANGIGAMSEPGVVNLIQVVHQLVAPCRQFSQPTGGVAFAALHQGQIQAIGLGLQVGVRT